MEKEEKIVINADTVVQMAYNLSVEGEEVESDTLEYLHGHGNLISGLEKALEGMAVGETKEVHVAAAEAYGDFDDNLVAVINRESFPKDFEIKLGQTMRMRDNEGHIFSGVATSMDDQVVEVNMNHPMAGKDLDFKVTILDIRPASSEEIKAGHLGSDCSCDSCGDGCASGGCGDGGCCG
ncbi:MAG: peptidylprolyl isomerase [Anaerolineaceae bacterium]|nr:peptidylprolyl isomerase [Anaerolineaceae bacterium]